MSILTQKLPETVEIGGREYPIKTDFREWIHFETVLSDPRESDQSKMLCLLTMFRELPLKFNDALQAAMKFYAGNDMKTEPGKQTGTETQKTSPRIYSYEHDADYIYSAFWSQYVIDLQEAELHWWQFKALFKGLEETNLIVKIMGYRGTDLSQIKDKEQKRFYRRMKRVYKLPDMRTEEQREKDMVNSLASVF